jgi:hypothetical protein
LGRETIFRGVINGVNNLTAVTVNVLLMTVLPIYVARCETSTTGAHSLPVHPLCLEE